MFWHILFSFILRTKNGDEIDKKENVEEVTKQPSVSSVKQLIAKEDKVSKNKDTLLPRLVANGTQLVKSWEDQYYVVNEYRANAHQVRCISSKYPKGRIPLYLHIWIILLFSLSLIKMLCYVSNNEYIKYSFMWKPS